jgi:hypothetical protein
MSVSAAITKAISGPESGTATGPIAVPTPLIPATVIRQLSREVEVIPIEVVSDLANVVAIADSATDIGAITNIRAVADVIPITESTTDVIPAAESTTDVIATTQSVADVIATAESVADPATDVITTTESTADIIAITETRAIRWQLRRSISAAKIRPVCKSCSPAADIPTVSKTKVPVTNIGATADTRVSSTEVRTICRQLRRPVSSGEISSAEVSTTDIAWPRTSTTDRMAE